MPQVIDLFAGIDLPAAFARTATIESANDIEPAIDAIATARAFDEAAEVAEAVAAAKTDLGVAAWVGAANAEQTTRRRRKRNPAA